MSNTQDQNPLIKGPEMKQLQRSFNFLANFVEVNEIRQKIKPKVERKRKIMDHKRNPDNVNVLNNNNEIMNEDEIDEELKQLLEEIEALEAQIDEIQSRPDRKIELKDLSEALKGLGRKCTRKEVEEIIWEVDEDLDGCISWDEMIKMYERNIDPEGNKYGMEPFQFFLIVQFLMFDKDLVGTISVDETMDMLYRRYGKDKFEAVYI